MYRQALEIKKNALGENHPSVATSYNNLAELLKDQNKLAEAEAMFRQALAIRKNALGEDHPSLTNMRGNLGIVLDAKARKLDEDGASDPAALAQIYSEAADMLAFSQSLSQSPSLSQFAAKDEDVLRCRKRAAEPAPGRRPYSAYYSGV